MTNKDKYKKRKENKEVRELHRETKREIRRENRIPFSKRREIAKRAKVEAGYKGGEGGKGKKLRTGGKGRYNLEGGEGGTKRGYEKKPTPPPPPKKETVSVKAKTYASQAGLTGESEFLDASSRDEMISQTKKAKQQAGSYDNKPSSRGEDADKAADVGTIGGTYTRNKEKAAKYKKAKKQYETGERTVEQKRKMKRIADLKTKYIKEAGGNIRKGKRKLKGKLKEKMKREYREGTYKKY